MIAAVLFTLPATAQQAITPQEFLDRMNGLTAWFSAQNFLVGIEHFNGDGTSLWMRADGTCSIGAITVNEGQVCFTYEDNPDQTYCWYPFVQGDTVTVESANVDGSVQTITRTSRSRLSCNAQGAGV